MVISFEHEIHVFLLLFICAGSVSPMVRVSGGPGAGVEKSLGAEKLEARKKVENATECLASSAFTAEGGVPE